MKRAALLLMVCAVCLFGLTLHSAHAIPAFKKEFDDRYVKKDSTEPAEKALAEAVKQAKCSVCHGKNAQGKDDKKVRNSYGMALSDLLDMKADIKNKEKIQQALEKVEGEHSVKDDPKSPTFGDLIKEGKLPGGEEK
jgi:hypothetical protein